MHRPEKTLPEESGVPRVAAQPVIDYAGAGIENRVDPTRPGLSSLIFSALFFVPVIVQVYAIGMGLISLRQPRSADRALGIAGLILGSAALVWWIWITVRLFHGSII